MLADSLPDTYGRALFDRWLAIMGYNSSNPIETLCFLGKRCMGALEFESRYEMTECSLIEENGRAHFLTKHFDRENGRKIHMQTLCAMAHYDFRLLRGYSYEQAFNVMRTLRLPYSAVKEMFRHVVFNVVVRNQDDHTKNISFLIGEGEQWRLSPAYDMGYAYNPNGGWTTMHQMSIGGKYDEIDRKRPCILCFYSCIR